MYHGLTNYKQELRNCFETIVILLRLIIHNTTLHSILHTATEFYKAQLTIFAQKIVKVENGHIDIDINVMHCSTWKTHVGQVTDQLSVELIIDIIPTNELLQIDIPGNMRLM